MSNKNTISYYVDGLSINIDLTSLEDICKTLGSGVITFEKFDKNKDDQAKLRRALGNYGVEIPFNLTKMDYDLMCEKLRLTSEAVEQQEEVIIEAEVEAEVIETIEDIEVIEVTETIDNNNESMEDTTMNNNTNTMNDATVNAEKQMGKLEIGAKYLINNVDSIRKDIVKHAKAIESMSQKEIETYFNTKAKSIFTAIVDGATNYSKGLKEEMEDAPELGEYAKRADDIVGTINNIVDADGLNGWGKVKAVVVELVKWVVRVFIKIGQIILNIAVTVIVGVIKVGAIGLNTAFRTVGVINEEVVKPVVKSTRGAIARHKDKKADNIEFEEDFDDYEEELVK